MSYAEPADTVLWQWNACTGNVHSQTTALSHRDLNGSSTVEKKGKGAKPTPNANSASQKEAQDSSERKLAPSGLGF